MSNCKNIKFCVVEMLNTSKIAINPKEKAKVVTLLTSYIDKLIFNIVAVVCVICLHIGVKKVVNEHIVHFKEHIDKRCNLKSSRKNTKQKGGAFNTAAFYGVHEPQYSASNSTSDVMNVDWANNIARPKLGLTLFGGARQCDKLNKIIYRQISNIFKFFKVKVTKIVINEFVQIYNNHVNQLFAQLGKSKKELSYSKLTSILKKSKILKNDT